MAQGDSIGGIVTGEGTWQIRPPVGQVWLITYVNIYRIAGSVDIYLNDGIYNDDNFEFKYNDPNIRIFINNDLWMEIESTYAYNAAVWTGVQFK